MATESSFSVALRWLLLRWFDVMEAQGPVVNVWVPATWHT